MSNETSFLSIAWDMEKPLTIRPAYIVFRDHVSRDGLSFDTEPPRSIALRGVVNIVGETETDYIFAQAVGRDEFCLWNATAVCKADIETLIYLDDLILSDNGIFV